MSVNGRVFLQHILTGSLYCARKLMWIERMCSNQGEKPEYLTMIIGAWRTAYIQSYLLQKPGEKVSPRCSHINHNFQLIQGICLTKSLNSVLKTWSTYGTIMTLLPYCLNNSTGNSPPWENAADTIHKHSHGCIDRKDEWQVEVLASLSFFPKPLHSAWCKALWTQQESFHSQR